MAKADQLVRMRFVIQGDFIRVLTRKRFRTKTGATKPTGVSLAKVGAHKEKDRG